MDIELQNYVELMRRALRTFQFSEEGISSRLPRTADEIEVQFLVAGERDDSDMEKKTVIERKRTFIP